MSPESENAVKTKTRIQYRGWDSSRTRQRPRCTTGWKSATRNFRMYRHRCGDIRFENQRRSEGGFRSRCQSKIQGRRKRLRPIQYLKLRRQRSLHRRHKSRYKSLCHIKMAILAKLIISPSEMAATSINCSNASTSYPGRRLRLEFLREDRLPHIPPVAWHHLSYNGEESYHSGQPYLSGNL